MEQAAILFSVAETLKNGAREVTSAPNNWFKNGKLHWPNKGVSLKRKNRVEPESDWQQFDYKILKADIKTLREALAEEKRYALYSNSESEREAENLKKFQRLHPAGTKNAIDANDMFDKTKKNSGIDEMKSITILEEIVFDPVLPENLLQGPEDGEMDLSLQIGSSVGSIQNQNEEYLPNLDVGSIVKISDVIDINKDSPCTIVSGVYQDQQNYLKNQIIPPGTINTSSNSMQCTQYQHQSQQQKDQGPQIHYQGQPLQCLGQSFQYLGQPQQYLALPHQYQGKQQLYQGQLQQYQGHQAHNFIQNDLQNLYEVQHNQYQNVNQNQPSSSFINNIDREGDNRQGNHHTANTCTTSSVSHSALGTSNLANIYSSTYGGFETGSTSKSLKYGQVKNASTKTIRSKTDSSKLAKGQSQILKNKKQMLKSLAKSTLSGRNVQVKGNRNTNVVAFGSPSEKALDGPINNSSVASIEYLPLIYKEILAMKQFNMAEAAKRQINDKKLAIVEQAQARNFEKLINMERVIVGEIKTINQETNVLTPEEIKEIDAELPKKSVDLIEEFEVKLNLEPVYKNKVTSRMKKLGGKKANLMVRSVMKKLVTDPVLDRYTWTGNGLNKKNFQKLANINEVVYDAVSGVFKNYTLHKYGKYMVEFLKHSASRQRASIKYRKGLTNQNKGLGDEDGDSDDNWDDAGGNENDMNDEEEDGEEKQSDQYEENEEDEDDDEDDDEEGENEEGEDEDEEDDI